MSSTNPLFNRKPVPDEFIEGVGVTGMTKEEEFLARERKLSTAKGDVRRFSNPKTKEGKLNPLYSRKPVPDELIRDVGVTGMSKEEEEAVRERKMYDKNGVDIRRFGHGYDSGIAPQADPFYHRKPVPDGEIKGVGETGLSKAEEFEVRENKEALFSLSSDPFQSSKGHRGSIAAPFSGAAAEARRRSSAGLGAGTQNASTNAYGSGAQGGYSGNTSHFTEGYGGPTSTTTTTTTTTSTATGVHGTHNAPGTQNQHGLYHDVATNDPEDVAPDERR